MLNLLKYIFTTYILVGFFSCESVIPQDDANYDGDNTAEELFSDDEIDYPDFFPPWSWDFVPKYSHIRSYYDLTDEEAKAIAKSDLVGLANGQGRYDAEGKDRGSWTGMQEAAKKIKKYNPDIYVMPYFSFRTDYGALYGEGSSGSILNDNPDWALYDIRTNEFTLVSDTYRRFDFSYPQNIGLIDRWIQDVQSWIALPDLDGIFIDSYGFTVSLPSVDNAYGQGKYNMITAGANYLRQQVASIIKPNNLIIGNCVGSYDDTNFEIIETVHGGMMEHFCILSNDNDDDIIGCIESIRKCASMGKILCVKAWTRYHLLHDVSHLTQEYLEQCAREDIVFPLAVFLCGAGKYSYFSYAWQYGTDEGGLIDYEEYTKPLGEPLGDYHRNGYVCTREFQHASVWVDILSREAKIDWHD